MPVCQCGPLSVSKVPLTLMLRRCRCRCRCWDRCAAMHTIQHKLRFIFISTKTNHAYNNIALSRPFDYYFRIFNAFSSKFISAYRLETIQCIFPLLFFIYVYSQAIKIQSIRFDSIWILIRIWLCINCCLFIFTFFWSFHFLYSEKQKNEKPKNWSRELNLVWRVCCNSVEHVYCSHKSDWALWFRSALNERLAIESKMDLFRCLQAELQLHVFR